MHSSAMVSLLSKTHEYRSPVRTGFRKRGSTGSMFGYAECIAGCALHAL